MDGNDWLVGGIAGAAGVVSSWLVSSAARGKTKGDVKTALDARIDARVEAQLKGAWKRIDELEVEQSEMKDHAASQDRRMRELELIDARKTSVLQRVFTALAQLLPEKPHLALSTDEINLVRDILPRDWLTEGEH